METRSLKDLPNNIEFTTFVAGTDFGYNNSHTLFGQAIKYKDDPIPKYYIVREFAGIKMTTPDLITELQFIIDTEFNKIIPECWGVDPAGNQVNSQNTWSDYSLFKKAFPSAIYTHHKELVAKLNQVQLFRKLLKLNKLFIDPKCKLLVKAFVRATPDANKTGVVRSAGWLKSGNQDHPLDSLSYLLINHNPGLIVSKKKTEPLSEFEKQRRLSEFFDGA